jgi:methyl-accepting chemotaxis protein
MASDELLALVDREAEAIERQAAALERIATAVEQLTVMLTIPEEDTDAIP